MQPKNDVLNVTVFTNMMHNVIDTVLKGVVWILFCTALYISCLNVVFLYVYDFVWGVVVFDFCLSRLWGIK